MLVRPHCCPSSLGLSTQSSLAILPKNQDVPQKTMKKGGFLREGAICVNERHICLQVDRNARRKAEKLQKSREETGQEALTLTNVTEEDATG